MSEPIGNTKQLAEPVAVRYDFDGYGYIYMDAGSGSDWASRVKDCEFLYTHPISEPIGNTEQLPIAWVYPEFMENIKDAKCWTAYSTYHKNRPIPLYAHPMRELTRKDFLEIWENEVNKFHDVEEYDIANFARAIIKASRGEK